MACLINSYLETRITLAIGFFNSEKRIILAIRLPRRRTAIELIKLVQILQILKNEKYLSKIKKGGFSTLLNTDRLNSRKLTHMMRNKCRPYTNVDEQRRETAVFFFPSKPPIFK